MNGWVGAVEGRVRRDGVKVEVEVEVGAGVEVRVEGESGGGLLALGHSRGLAVQ